MADKLQQVQLFYCAEDEVALTHELRERVPDLQVIDGARWETADPPVRPTVADCSGHFAYLWSPAVAADLPTVRRHGKYDGPKTGVVIQFQRSILDERVLLSGRIAVGFRSEQVAMSEFVAHAWTSMRKTSVGGLETALGQKVRTHRIGRLAADKVRKHQFSLEDYGSPVVYRLHGE